VWHRRGSDVPDLALLTDGLRAEREQGITIDVARGDLLVAGPLPASTRTLMAEVCWMAEAPLRAGGRYALKHTTSTVRAIVDGGSDRLDVATLSAISGPAELAVNDIGRVALRVSRELAVDPYAVNRATGAFILVDEASNETVAAGMVLAAT